jgi:hypothetical protein
VAQERYRVSSLDDVSGLLDIFEGGLGEDGALTVDNVRTNTFYRNASGVRVHTRLRFAPSAGGLFRLDIHESVDEGRNWAQSTRYVANRRLVP